MIFIKKIIRFPFNFFWLRSGRLNNQQKTNGTSTTINKPLRKRLFSFIKRHKKLILAIFIFLLVFFSFYQVSLAVLDAVAELKALKAKIGKTMAFIAAIPLLSMAFFHLGELLLGLATLPGFLGGLDFTMANPIIDLGWTVVRDFVNMFFILILVVIGLGIALRLKEYDIKKLLPKFFAAVLLVNFGPPILALIAEIAETFMNFFLAEVRGLSGFVGLLTEWSWSGMAVIITSLVALGVAFFIPYGWLGVVALGGVGIGLFTLLLPLTLFNLIAGIIFIMFGLLLLARQIAIWILIIISPVAFLLWAIPGNKTEGYAKMWWQQFLQWSFVGIPAAFFLYLAAHLTATPMPGLIPIFRLLVIMVFLVIGFIITIKTGPLGAKYVTGFALSSTKRAAGFAGQRTLERYAPGFKRSAIEGAKRLQERGGWGARTLQRGLLGVSKTMDKPIKRKEQRERERIKGTWGEGWEKAREGEIKIDPKNSAAVLQEFKENKDDPKKQSSFFSKLHEDSLRAIYKAAETEKEKKDIITTIAMSKPGLAWEMVDRSEKEMRSIYEGMNRKQFSNMKINNDNEEVVQQILKNNPIRLINFIQDSLDSGNQDNMNEVAKMSFEDLNLQSQKYLESRKELMGFLKQPEQPSKK